MNRLLKCALCAAYYFLSHHPLASVCWAAASAGSVTGPRSDGDTGPLVTFWGRNGALGERGDVAGKLDLLQALAFRRG